MQATAEVVVEPMHLDGDGPPWESVAEDVRACRGGEALLVRPFAGGVPLVERPADVAELRRLVTSAFRPGRPVIDAARAFCHTIHETFEYDRTFTDVSTPLATVLAARRGVCQDFAHLAAGGLRLLGLAARYVSGYIETTPPPGRRASSVPTRRTRGARCGCPTWAGSTSTPPTITFPCTATSRWRGVATTTTCLPSAAW